MGDIPYGIEYFPVDCQNAIRRNMCSEIYGKCASGENAYRIYPNTTVSGENYSLPFQRPCMSLCTELPLTCSGLPAFFGYVPPNCNERMDYSSGVAVSSADAYPLKYDASNNGSVCNDMTTNGSASVPMALVGVTTEPYMHANNSDGACYGIVDNVYLPPVGGLGALGVSLDPITSYSPLQPPHAVQTLLEETLNDILSTIPVWLNKSCYIDFKMYICGKVMQRPVPVTLLDGVFESNKFGSNFSVVDWLAQASIMGFVPLNDYNITAELLYQPMYVGDQVTKDECLAYTNGPCDDFLATLVELSPQLLTSSPFLFPRCSMYEQREVTSVNMTLHPDIYVSGMLNASHGNDYDEPGGDPVVWLFPHEVTEHRRSALEVSTVVAYEPQCPPYFAPPKNIYSNTHVVAGTGCAMGCKSPRLDPHEWETQRLVMFDELLICLTLSSSLLITWLMHPVKRKQHLVLFFMLFAVLVTCVLLWGLLVPFGSFFCKDETTIISAEDGLSDCAVQNIMIVASITGLAVTWCCISFQTAAKLIVNMKIELYYFYFVIFSVSVLSGALVYITDSQSYSQSTYICAGSERGSTIIGSIMLFFVAFGIACCCAVIVVIVQRISNTSSSATEKAAMWPITIGPLKFLFSFMGLWLCVVGRTILLSDEGEMITWMECIFFKDPYGQFSPWSVPGCPSHYPGRRPFILNTSLTAFICGNGIFLFFIHAYDFVTIWRVWLGYKPIQAKEELTVTASSGRFMSEKEKVVRVEVRALSPIPESSYSSSIPFLQGGWMNNKGSASLVVPFSSNDRDEIAQVQPIDCAVQQSSMTHSLTDRNRRNGDVQPCNNDDSSTHDSTKYVRQICGVDGDKEYRLPRGRDHYGSDRVVAFQEP